MKKIFFILYIFLFSCQTTPKVVYQFHIPEYSCPEIIDVNFDELSTEKSEEENLLVRANNLATIKRLIDNLLAIIECHEKNIEQIRQINKEKEKKDE